MVQWVQSKHFKLFRLQWVGLNRPLRQIIAIAFHYYAYYNAMISPMPQKM